MSLSGRLSSSLWAPQETLRLSIGVLSPVFFPSSHTSAQGWEEIRTEQPSAAPGVAARLDVPGLEPVAEDAEDLEADAAVDEELEIEDGREAVTDRAAWTRLGGLSDSPAPGDALLRWAGDTASAPGSGGESAFVA